MKQVVFSEGKYDTEFLQAAITSHTNSPTIDRLDIPSGPSDKRNPRESNRIRQFKKVWNNDDILLKSEGGKPNLLDTVPVMIRQLYDSRLDLHVLVDLDRKNPRSIAKDINKKLDSRCAGQDIYVRGVGEREQYDEMVYQNIEVVVNDDPKSQFSLLAFKTDLEDVAGINKDSDTPEEMEEKAQNLATQRTVRIPVIRMLF